MKKIHEDLTNEYSADDILEFYRDNGVELLSEDGSLDMLYFEQVTNDTYEYNMDSDSYNYIGGN